MKHLNRSLGITMACFSFMMLTAYFGLVSYFEFPDILRTEQSYMLNKFIENQNVIVPFYYLFVLSQVTFIAIVLQFHSYYRKATSALLTVATGFGILAGLCQAIGFLRWPFLTPYLAGVITDPNSTIASKQAAEIVFKSFHQFAGVAVGENLFFVLEGIWGICFGLFLLITKSLNKNLSLIPLAAGIGILIYSLEQFGGSFSILAPLNVIAHGAIVFWFIALTIIFLREKNKISGDMTTGKRSTVILWVVYLLIIVPGLLA